MARLERILIAVNRALVAAALAAVFVIVITNVVGRYLFGSSLAWGEEVARFLMIFGVFAGAGLALRSGRLVEIDLFVALSAARSQNRHPLGCGRGDGSLHGVDLLVRPPVRGIRLEQGNHGDRHIARHSLYGHSLRLLPVSVPFGLRVPALCLWRI